MRPSSLVARRGAPALFAIAAVITGAHAVDAIEGALGQPSAHGWLVALHGLLRTGVALTFAVFTVGRAAPRNPSRSPVAFVACAAAMAGVIAFTAPGSDTPAGVVLAGELVAVIFSAWLFVSVFFLGHCFGVLPEARGLVTAGPYRIVRHPVYLGEIGACVGLAIAAPSLQNAVALTAVVVGQGVRMRLEERALTHAFADYAEYAARTPRLVPRVRSQRPVRTAPGVAVLTEH
jgi:protein-S-isoprenylcysteine O-methyltransferase Ste14